MSQDPSTKTILIGIFVFLILFGLSFLVYFVLSSPTSSSQNTKTLSAIFNNSNLSISVPISNITNTPIKKNFTASEVAFHNNSSDCYIAYKNKVYDITSFLPNHIKGANKPTKQCGKIVDDFSEIHPGGSFDEPQIQAVLTPSYVGELTN